jgi:2-desacetyl-2-hydroxyethyl bacteriochlorophyllide A dehydrogenase
VRVRACGICPTDLRKYAGKSGARLPLVLGHEPAGDVISVGPDVESVGEGDRVCLMPWWPCGRCATCRLGQFIQYPDLTSIGGAAEKSVMVDGAFSECMKIPERAVIELDPGVSYEAATFADPLTSALNSIERCRIPIGGDAVIVGAGPLGMMHLQLAKLRGAKIIVSDTIAERREMVLDLGAHEIIDPAETDPVEAVRELTGGEGADAVVVAVGSKEAEEQAVGMLRNNGVVSIFAGTYPATTIEVDPNDIHYTEKVVTGAFAGSPEQFTRAVKLISVGLVDVEALITHRMPLDNLDEGFEMTLEGVGMKKMILP